jgi:predicted nuclease of predicted toxin-antitoxin system
VIIWIDEQWSPDLAAWFARSAGITATPLRELGLARAPDRQIFDLARAENAVIVTKDRDFVDLLRRRGPPPRIVWGTCGNTSNAYLRGLFHTLWPEILQQLRRGEALIEVADRKAMSR